MNPAEYTPFRIEVLYLDRLGNLAIEEFCLGSSDSCERVLHFLRDEHLPWSEADCWFLKVEEQTPSGWRKINSQWQNRDKFVQYMHTYRLSFPVRLCEKSGDPILKNQEYPIPGLN